MKPDLTIIAGPADGADAAEPQDGSQRSANPTSGEQCVSLESLAMPDDSEQMANPEVGDVVTYQVEGKVSRIEGEKAYVVPTSINGKPVDDANEQEAPGPEEQDANDFSALQDAAQKQGAM